MGRRPRVRNPHRGADRTVGRVAAAVLLAGTVVASGLVLAACAGPDESGPPAARVTAWVEGAGAGAAVGALRGDVARVDRALSLHDTPAQIRTVCAVLTNDAETAIGDLPTPDHTLTADLNSAYSDAAAAGDDCYNGASDGASLLARSAAERSRLGPLLATALDRISAVSGHTPSTSTTQPVAGVDPFGG